MTIDENRRIEKILTESEAKFHDSNNQEKFQEIYAKSDELLKNKITEAQFVSYLEVSKKDSGKTKLNLTIGLMTS